MENPEKKRILDIKPKQFLVPDQLKRVHKGNVIQAISKLVHGIKLSLRNNEDLSTFQRAVKILVRGLGSSNTIVQRNYFLALEIVLSNYKTSSWFSIESVSDAVKTELQISTNTSKGDEGEILLGRVLVFGVLVRSGVLISSSVDEQTTIVTNLLQDMKGKSYLPFIADAFMKQYLEEIDKSIMKKVVWPVVQKQLSPGPSQSLIMYHLLVLATQKFPSVVNAKALEQAMGVPAVFCASNMPAFLTALQNDFKIKSLKHPVYDDVLKAIATGPEDVLVSFWHEVNQRLLIESSSPTNKHILAMKFFNCIVSNLQSASQVLHLITPKFVTWLTKKQNLNGYYFKAFNEMSKDALNNLCKLCEKPELSKSVISIIKKIMFESGNALLEHNSGPKLVQQLSIYLTEKAVMKLASKVLSVVMNTSNVKELKEPHTTRPWHNSERLHAKHFFCSLLALPVMQANTTWRLEQMTKLFDLGFFPTANVGVELAGLIRESFYGCLYHKMPSLVEVRNLLAGIAKHISNRLDKGDELRIKVSQEVLSAWKSMYITTEKIKNSKKHEKEQWVTSVFQTMFFHIGLHLFKEAAFATDVLKELHSVYERVSGTKGAEEGRHEPHWTEVVVEMVLSLLSRNSQLHRHLIGCIFGHLCPLMTPQNIHQILQVLDPTDNSNPLLNSLDSESETSSSDDEDMEGASDDGDEMQDESSDDGMSDDDAEEETDEPAIDKLKRAVVEALGDNGALTDVESVDLDEMDEEEAVRVDKALSEAFRANRQVKNKRASPPAKALINFRLRVLDLLEVWANHEPQLDLLLDTLLTLISLLEYSLVDRHQVALEARLRTVIKKLTATKKCKVSECPTLPLGSMLKSLLDKGRRTTTVYMSIIPELKECTMFILRMSSMVSEPAGEDTSEQLTVFEVMKDAVDHFFRQRDCLLTPAFYEVLFRQNIPFIAKIAIKLPRYAFDPNVHSFRRGKALEFLLIFCKHNRAFHQNKEEHMDCLKKLAKHLLKGTTKMLEEPSKKVNPKFIMCLIKVLNVVRLNNWAPDVDWSGLAQKLIKMQKSQRPEKENKINPPKTNGVETKSCNSDTEELEINGENSVEEEDKSLTKQGQNDVTTHTSPRIKSKGDAVKRKKKNQSLKNNSKKMRLATMSEGLENNLFSKYKLLENGTNPGSPER